MLVSDFYNQKIQQLLALFSNGAHFALESLEKYHNVIIITQNIGDLHKRVGTSKILHLHGKPHGTKNKKTNLSYRWGSHWEISSKYEPQSQPNIISFAKEMPLQPQATTTIKHANALSVVITRLLQAYPATVLIYHNSQLADIHHTHPQTGQSENGMLRRLFCINDSIVNTIKNLPILLTKK